MSETPGRNDPCPCGSGQKYKNCHMKIDKESVRQRMAWHTAAQWLRRELLQFAREEQFAASFAAALSFYWHGLYTIDNAEEMAEDEALRFFDWFLYDYVGQAEAEERPRLIDSYSEAKREELTADQAAILEAWRNAQPAGAYELRAVDGQTLQAVDIVSGESFEIHSTAGRGVLEIGDVILARLLPMRDRLEFSTTAAYLPQAEIADLPDKLAAARVAYDAAQPDGNDSEFMRRHNHLLIHHALEQAEMQKRPPVARLDPERSDKGRQKLVRQLKRFKR